MTDTPKADEREHRMIGGSHERRGGPECKCGADWDYWSDKCTAQEEN